MNIREALKGPAMRLLGYREERVSAATWDREYREGDWKFLGQISSLAGQLSVFGYLQYLAPATILDVGCGAGLLAAKLKSLPYTSFLGLDISAEAIAQAASVADERTSFAVADANAFHTDRTFDTIVFNQCLNYFPDPAAVEGNYEDRIEAFRNTRDAIEVRLKQWVQELSAPETV